MTAPHISRVTIKNFRNLHDLDAEFSSNAVIVGENRAGKSNLLHALRLVLDPSLPDTARDLRSEDFWDGLAAPFNGHEVCIEVHIRGFDGNKEAEAVLADCVVEKKPLTACLTYKYRPRPTLELDDDDEQAEISEDEDEGEDKGGLLAATEDEYEFVVFGGTDEAHGVGREVRRWLSLTVLPAMRDATTQLAGSRRTLLQPLLDRIRPEVDPATLQSVRDDLDEAAARLLAEKPLQDLEGRVNDRLRDLVGTHFAVRTKFDFAESEANQLLNSLRLFIDDGKTRSLADASLGTANLIFLGLLLQDLDEKTAKRESVGTILGVEEPEAHLHPHIQRLLFRYALRRKHSVLVTTHSPHIASVAPLQAIMVLRGSSTGSCRLCTVNGLDLEEQDVEDLERYLDVTRAEMLFAKGIIFVEGIAEEFLVPAFAAIEMQRRKLGGSLDELGITVCSVGGTDFSPYWSVTSSEGWDIPRVILTDGDPSTNDEDVISLAGLRRGASLLGDPDIISKAKTGDSSEVRKALRRAGIFVNQGTLETDLIADFSEEMTEAFSAFVGTKTAKRFSEAMDEALSGDEEAADRIVALIEERVGKGRFAQRLASKLTEDHPVPDYIKHALEAIFKLTGHA